MNVLFYLNDTSKYYLSKMFSPFLSISYIYTIKYNHASLSPSQNPFIFHSIYPSYNFISFKKVTHCFPFLMPMYINEEHL